MKKLSIITINYNHLDGLRRTFESVKAQTWKDFEWIIVDGGSEDGSRGFIEENASHFTFWCSEKDSGVYNAQNKGLRHASGEYLVFLNSGDSFASSSTLQIVFGNQERHADILFGYMMRQSLCGLPNNWPSMKYSIFWEDFYFDTLPHQSSYIKRSLFERYGGYDEDYQRLADWKWFFNVIINHNASVEFMPYKLSIYEGDGISEDSNSKEEIRRLKEELFPAYIKEEDLMTIKDVRAIWNYPLTRLAYRIIRRLAHTYRWHRQKAMLKHAKADCYAD